MTQFAVVIMQRIRDNAQFAVLLENDTIVAAFGPIGSSETHEDVVIRWDQWGADLGAEIANNLGDYSERQLAQLKTC
jgi:hypothetical protein